MPVINAKLSTLKILLFPSIPPTCLSSTPSKYPEDLTLPEHSPYLPVINAKLSTLQILLFPSIPPTCPSSTPSKYPAYLTLPARSPCFKNNLPTCYLYSSCLFHAAAITAVQTARSSVVLSSSVALIPRHVDRLSSSFICWAHLDFPFQSFPLLLILEVPECLIWPMSSHVCLLPPIRPVGLSCRNVSSAMVKHKTNTVITFQHIW